jgi:hypothetical protein
MGFVPSYLFSADITKQGRLHLHGAIQADESQRPLIEEAMKQAWGEWKGRGKEHQVDWNPKRCDDGWPDYFLKARPPGKGTDPRTHLFCQQGTKKTRKVRSR